LESAWADLYGRRSDCFGYRREYNDLRHGSCAIDAPGTGRHSEESVLCRNPGRCERTLSPVADLFEISRQTASLRTLVAYGPERLTLTTDEGSYASFGSYVTTNYFDGLGVRLVKGRSFMEAENQIDSSGLVAVISYRMWQERFHGSEEALGRFVVLNGHPATVIGIAPPRFQGADLGFVEDVWVPMISYLRVEGRQSAMNERSRPAFA
jgi:hypothetical protein